MTDTGQGGAAVSSLESQRKGGLGGRLLLPWLQVSLGPGAVEKESRDTGLGRKGRGYNRHGHGPEGALGRFICFREPGCLGVVPGEGLRRICISFPGVSSQIEVSTDWSVRGEGPLVIAFGHDVSRDIASSGLSAFLGLELKHSGGQNITSGFIRTLPPGPADLRLVLRMI